MKTPFGINEKVKFEKGLNHHVHEFDEVMRSAEKPIGTITLAIMEDLINQVKSAPRKNRCNPLIFDKSIGELREMTDEELKPYYAMR